MVVIILDNSPLIVERLIDLIAETNRGVTFHHADRYNTGMALLKECSPDVVVMDLKLSGNNVVKLLKQIKEYNNKTVVIILYSVKDEQELEQCKTQGADYILDKYNEFEKIPAIISSRTIKIGITN